MIFKKRRLNILRVSEEVLVAIRSSPAAIRLYTHHPALDGLHPR